MKNTPIEEAVQRTAGIDLLTAEELTALRRFDECAQDGEGYDVPKEMMVRLAEIGVVRRRSGAYYQATEFGMRVLAVPTSPSAGELADEQCDAVIKAALEEMALKRGLHPSEVSQDTKGHWAWGRALVRAGAALAQQAGSPAPAGAGEQEREFIVFGGRRMGRTHLAKLERDAARYRWLREHWFFFGTSHSRTTTLGHNLHRVNVAGDIDTLDAAIDANIWDDAAMAATQPKGADQ